MEQPQFTPQTIESLLSSTVPELREIGEALESGNEHPFSVDYFESSKPVERALPKTAAEAAARGGATRFDVQVSPVPKA